jgi:signal transduction histidine kinase
VHDELGQSLTGLKMDLYWLSSRVPRQLRELHEKAKSMSAHIDSTIQTVRRISTELRPGILDDLGLVAALEWQAAEFQKRTGIRCEVASELKQTMLNEELNTAFFRIFQEILTNVIRHAKATKVTVEIRRIRGQLMLTVEDNGRGISEGEISNTKSIGLLGMRERAALLGGKIFFSGVRGQGTTVTVRIPLSRPETQNLNHENSHRRRSRGRAPRIKANSSR